MGLYQQRHRRHDAFPLVLPSRNSRVDIGERMISVILLAGGQGTRFGSEIPKQFVHLRGKPIALYSYELFCRIAEIKEMIIVCDPRFRHIFNIVSESPTIKFALPGERRQDSVYNGLQCADPNTEFVCIHDSARPLICESMIER